MGVESQGIWYFLEQARETDVYPMTARAVKVFLNGRNGEVGHCVNSLLLRYGGPIFVKPMR